MINADLEVLTTCVAWLNAGHQVELVTVAKTWGSSPKPVGSLAAVRDDGVLVGSVSGGCVEKQLSESFRTKEFARVHSHKIDDEQARRFGLACGGELELVYESLNDAEQLQTIIDALKQRQRVTRICSIGTTDAQLKSTKANDTFSFDGSNLIKVFGPEWQVLLIGAGQLSSFVAQFALALDFHVLVCDPRPEFQQAWTIEGTTLLTLEPHEAVLQYATDFNTAVLALTHDPNLDDMALLEALPMDCFYVGALGSKRNYEKRCKRLSLLLEANDLQRLRSPIGLPIGSRSSAEIAVSIAAELVKARSSACQPSQAESQVNSVT